MEKINLDYIYNLSEGDKIFEDKLKDVLKKELPEEYNLFLKHLDSGNYKEAALVVHKMKYKVQIMGLSEAFVTVAAFEKDLKKNSDLKHLDFFKSTIERMLVYLSKID